eukprot:5442425-Pyramimonas_sp.AAC.2
MATLMRACPSFRIRETSTESRRAPLSAPRTVAASRALKVAPPTPRPALSLRAGRHPGHGHVRASQLFASSASSVSASTSVMKGSDYIVSEADIKFFVENGYVHLPGNNSPPRSN